MKIIIEFYRGNAEIDARPIDTKDLPGDPKTIRVHLDTYDTPHPQRKKPSRSPSKSRSTAKTAYTPTKPMHSTRKATKSSTSK